MSNPNTMTVPEAADVLQRTQQCIRENLHRLGGKRILGRWVVDTDLVQKHAAGIPVNDPCQSTSRG
jgi:hypothetical protein